VNPNRKSRRAKTGDVLVKDTSTGLVNLRCVKPSPGAFGVRAVGR
jgi:hypothetical protein